MEAKLIFLIGFLLLLKSSTEAQCSEKFEPCHRATGDYDQNQWICARLCGSADESSVRCHPVSGHCECGQRAPSSPARVHSACSSAPSFTDCFKTCAIRGLDGVLCNTKRRNEHFRESNVFCLCAYNPIIPNDALTIDYESDAEITPFKGTYNNYRRNTRPYYNYKVSSDEDEDDS